jgi:putative serine protease PepD
MTDNRFDLGRPAGPDFLPPTGLPLPPPQPAPGPSIPSRIRTDTTEAAPQPASAVVPAQPARRSGRSTAMLVAACLVAAGAAGAGAAVVAVDGMPTSSIRQYQPDPRGAGGVPDAQSAAAAVLPSVVDVRAGNAGGSGFAIDQEGHVITNSHVVEGRSRVVGTDPDTDVAVLEVASGAPPAATLGVSSEVRIGQPVIAVGAPLGLTSTVTAGIVSALDRTARLGQSGGPQQMVQTDASINPGNSGGPLANLQGQVVGVNTALATMGAPDAGNIGIGFAVPIDRAVAVARQIIEND